MSPGHALGLPRSQPWSTASCEPGLFGRGTQETPGGSRGGGREGIQPTRSVSLAFSSEGSWDAVPGRGAFIRLLHPPLGDLGRLPQGPSMVPLWVCLACGWGRLCPRKQGKHTSHADPCLVTLAVPLGRVGAAQGHVATDTLVSWHRSLRGGGRSALPLSEEFPLFSVS